MPFSEKNGRLMLRRRVQWTPATNSDETDSEFDGAMTPSELSDEDDGSEYVGSEYGGDTEERRISSRIRAPALLSSTSFSVGQNVWFPLKGAWYFGKIKQLVIDPSSKGIRTCPLYEVHFRHRKSFANMRTTIDPLEGTTKRDTQRVRDWLRENQYQIGSNWDALPPVQP